MKPSLKDAWVKSRDPVRAPYLGAMSYRVDTAVLSSQLPIQQSWKLRKPYPADIVAAEATEWVEWDYDAPWFAMVTKSEGLFFVAKD